MSGNQLISESVISRTHVNGDDVQQHARNGVFPRLFIAVLKTTAYHPHNAHDKVTEWHTKKKEILKHFIQMFVSKRQEKP
jgi:hypothetical protein